MPSRSFSIVAVAHLLTVIPVVKAQISVPQCVSGFGWMSNSRGQNPCLVSAYAMSACSGGSFTIPPLTVPGDYYLAPNVSQADLCQCSTVGYSLMSACSICQNGTFFLSWSRWIENCPPGQVSVAKYPESVPSETAIPNWAFLNVTITDTFNTTAALADGDTPELTASSTVPTGTISNSATHSATLTVTVSPSLSSGSSGPHKSNTLAGAIAGGVVGGVVGLALIAGAVVFFMRRRQAKIALSSTRGSYGQGPPSEAPLNSPPLMQQFSQPPYGRTSYNGSNQYVGNSQPLYNPYDRITRPQDTGVGTSDIHTTSSGPGQLPYSASPPGRYSGVPEL